MNENTEKKMIAIGCVSIVSRFLMAAGCGLFVRNVTKQLIRDASFFKKLGVWTTALCTSWALGHAVDCYWDKATKILTETVTLVDSVKTDENEE